MSNPGVVAYQKQSNRDVTVEKYGYLVKRIGHHLMARLPDSVQLDDLLQAGMIGLLESVSKYDASKGASFETYAGIRIRGAMLDEMRRGDWAPRSVHRNTRRVSEAIKMVEHHTGRVASDREIAQAMEVPIEEYYNILDDAANCRLVSYEQVNESEDSGILPKIENEDLGAEYNQLIKQLGDAISKLPDRERLVMALYYDEELNLKEIGAILEVSESRVSQILSQATARVRANVTDWMAP